MDDLKHEYITANGIKMHYVTKGAGPLIILLHGFPENWRAFRHQIPPLAEHFQVVAVDLRGYGETERPTSVEDYRPDIIAQDISELIHALGAKKAHIVGHDWGGAIAFRLTLLFPEVVDHLCVMNAPHPRIFKKALSSNYKQMLKSWYIFFFQIPYLPELLFKLRSKSIFDKLFKAGVIRKDTFSEEDIKIYREAMEKPGAFTAALNYYRAALKKPKLKPKQEKISAPTLIIWGEKDEALGRELTYGMEPLFSGPFHIEYIPNCSHWVNEEQPEKVNELLLKFLSA